jgi:hypothetical protein
MKKDFDIEDSNLKKNPFSKRPGDAQRIRSGIERGINDFPETPQSKRVIYAAAAGILVITGLFSLLSRMDLDVDFYNSAPIAKVEAVQFEQYELNELDLHALTEATTQINTAGVTLNGFQADDIVEYLSQSDISTYELEQHY